MIRQAIQTGVPVFLETPAAKPASWLHFKAH
jgi:hypothetical protein